jgi:hypothetical protein
MSVASSTDYMDQLSQFRGAAKELVEREQELLRVADVVFAGGSKIGIENKNIALGMNKSTFRLRWRIFLSLSTGFSA